MMDKEAKSLERDWKKLPTHRDLARMMRDVLVIWECSRYDLTSEWAASNLRRKRNAIEIAGEFLDQLESGRTLSGGQTELALKLHRRAKAKKAKQGRKLRGRTSKQENTEEGESVEPGGHDLRPTEDREEHLVQQCVEGAVPGD